MATSKMKVSHGATVTLFGISGLVLGFFSMGFIPLVFYTTKPFHFLDEWALYLFVVLFAASFTLIPVAAARWPAIRIVRLFLVWIGATVIAGLVVSVHTAVVHNQTLSIPDWLLPTGLLSIPIISGVVTLVLARSYRSREKAWKNRCVTAVDSQDAQP
jgi:hypothetical protein